MHIELAAIRSLNDKVSIRHQYQLVDHWGKGWPVRDNCKWHFPESVFAGICVALSEV